MSNASPSSTGPDPLDTWRAPGRVNWALFNVPRRQHDQAERGLDAAFDLECEIAQLRIDKGWPRKLAAEAAFDAIGVTMRKYMKTGAMDTEPCANVRLALRSKLRARSAWR